VEQGFGGASKLDLKGFAIKPDGGFVVAATVFDNTYWAHSDPPASFILLATDSSGQIDIDTPFDPIPESASSNRSAMAVSPYGGVLVAGTLRVEDQPTIRLERYRSNWGYDSGFGNKGETATQFTAFDRANCIKIQPDGQIVVAGVSRMPDLGHDLGAFSMARFDGGGYFQPDLRFGRLSNASFGNDQYEERPNRQIKEFFPTSKRKRQEFFIRIQNDGNESDKISLKGRAGNKNVIATYFHGKRNVTGKVVAGTFTTDSLRPGESCQLEMRIETKAPDFLKFYEFRLRARSGSLLTARDQGILIAFGGGRPPPL